MGRPTSLFMMFQVKRLLCANSPGSKVGYDNYRSACLSKNAIQEIRPEAFQSSSSEQNKKLKQHLFQQQKGLCVTCGDLLPGRGSRRSFQGGRPAHARPYLGGCEGHRLVRYQSVGSIPLRESIFMKSPPQVKFLHDLMVRRDLYEPFQRFEDQGLSS